jgi:uncharacterized protein (DUF1015 family)
MFLKINTLYLAEASSFSRSSIIVRRKRDLENTAKDYLLSYLISENNVKIYEFNRLVKDLNGFEKRLL